MQHLHEGDTERFDERGEFDALQIDARRPFLQLAADGGQMRDEALHELERERLAHAGRRLAGLGVRVAQHGQKFEAAAAKLDRRHLADFEVAQRIDADHEERKILGQKRDHIADERLQAADLCAAGIEGMNDAQTILHLLACMVL